MIDITFKMKEMDNNRTKHLTSFIDDLKYINNHNLMIKGVCYPANQLR